MRNKILLFIFLGLAASITLSSYNLGAGQNGGYDCTGAESGLGNPSGCRNCHGNTPTASIGVTITLDSMGVPVTSYVAGMNYTVKISGINNGTLSLPKFGFQLTAIKGAIAAVTPVNAGTWASAGLPTSTRYSAAQATLYVVDMVEQSTRINATTGTGGAGTTYEESFTWTAPSFGTGTVSFWGVLNAVNANGNNDSGDKWNTATLVVTEYTGGIPVPSIDFTNASQTYSESQGSIQIPIHVTNIGNNAVTVNAIITSGSATAGSDFTCTTSQLITFPAGSSLTQNAVLTIVDDALVESTENFTVTLSSPNNGMLGSTTTFTGSITDNDFLGVSNLTNNAVAINCVPNVINNYCNLQVQNLAKGQYQVLVYNVNGNQVIENTVEITSSHVELPLPVQNLPAGCYWVMVKSNQASYSTKLVKQ